MVERMIVMDYQKHRKELLKDKAVRTAHEKLRPEYGLARSIIEQRHRKKMTQVDVAKKTA
jgi:hypothetical protein